MATASAAAGGQVKVFDPATGKELLALTDHAGAVRGLLFQADNRTLLSVGADKTARLSDLNLLAVYDAHPGGVAGVAFNGAGNQALSGGADKTLKLWDLTTGKPTRTIGPLADPVKAVAYSRDFTQVGAATGKTVKVWNVADGKEVLTLAHPAEVLSLSFSADKLKIATAAADNQTRVWDVATGKELQVFPSTGPVRAVAFHANNKDVIAAGDDKTATVHSVTMARVLSVGSPIRDLAVTPNGSHVLAAVGNEVKLWNAATGAAEPRTLAGSDKPMQTVTVSKNGVLVATGGDDQTVRVYTFADGKLLAAIKAPGIVRGLSFSANNQTLAAACEDKSVQTWNVVFTPGQPVPAEFGKPVQTNAHAAAATSVVFAPDNVTIYSASADKTVKAWKFASEAPTKNFPHPNLVDAVAFNPAGTQLATGCHDGKLRLFDVAKGAVIKEINAHVAPAPMGPSPIYCVAWTPDGKQVVSGSLDHSMKLWDAASGNLVREFKGYKEKDFEKGHRDGVFCVAFSPDGKTLVSGSSDRSVKLWNVADGTVTREFVNPNVKAGPAPAPPLAHPGWVYGVRFVQDGKYVISLGGAPMNKGFLGVWNVADGKMLLGEELPLGSFFALAVSPDGKSLAVGTGTSGRAAGQDGNTSYVLKMPEVVK
jgi:WD40 repeat protein